MKKIYIAGKISSYRWQNYLSRLERFRKLEKNFNEMGMEAINPANKYPQGMSWEWYMARICEYLVIEKPICYFMEGWKKSKGAKLEHAIAKSLNLKIIYE